MVEVIGPKKLLDGAVAVGAGTEELNGMGANGIGTGIIEIADTATVEFQGRLFDDRAWIPLSGSSMSSTGTVAIFGPFAGFRANVTSWTAGLVNADAMGVQPT